MFDYLFRPHPVAKLLAQAEQLLPAPPELHQLLPDSARTYQQVRASVENFVAEREWELALDDLAELGAALTPVPGHFWELLDQVGQLLQLPTTGAYWQQWRPAPTE